MRLLILILLFSLGADAQIIRANPFYKATISALPTFIGQVGLASTDGENVTTGDLNTTGATLLVASVASYTATPEPTITDSRGNTWIPLTKQENFTGVVRCRLYYCYSPITDASHSFSLSGTLSYPTIIVMAFSGTAGLYNAENGNIGTSPTSTGSITTVGSNEIVISALASNRCSGLTGITSGFTYYDIANVLGAAFSISIAYYIKPTAGSQNCTLTWCASEAGAAVIAGFN